MSRQEIPSREKVPEMFNRISKRYDLLNHLLSFGLDFYWRKQAVKELEQRSDQTVLDLACGTGDLALTAVKHKGCRVLGIDKAGGMLKLARRKTTDKNLEDHVSLVCGDGMALPLTDQSMDSGMIAFGIRNMPDTSVGLSEFFRVIRPGGRLVVLEFSLPANALLRMIYLAYFRYLLPFLGRVISGDSQAYRYLNQTAETYAHGEKFVEYLEEAGFENVLQRSLTWGVVTIYTGVRP